VKEHLIAKLQAPRPATFTDEEAALIREALREAVAVTLAVGKEQVGDDARIFDDLGLDSIDVFDVLDQLGEKFEIQMALEDLPNDMIRGGENATFRDFAEGILNYFRTPPRTPAPGAAKT
jgi:acyl carrier protein